MNNKRCECCSYHYTVSERIKIEVYLKTIFPKVYHAKNYFLHILLWLLGHFFGSRERQQIAVSKINFLKE